MAKVMFNQGRHYSEYCPVAAKQTKPWTIWSCVKGQPCRRKNGSEIAQRSLGRKLQSAARGVIRFRQVTIQQNQFCCRRRGEECDGLKTELHYWLCKRMWQIHAIWICDWQYIEVDTHKNLSLVGCAHGSVFTWTINTFIGEHISILKVLPHLSFLFVLDCFALFNGIINKVK